MTEKSNIDKKLEITEIDLLSVLEKNSDTMNKMTDLLEKEGERRFWSRVVWATAITIMVCFFIWCVSISEPTVVQNTNTNTNTNKNIATEGNVQYAK